MSLLLYSKLSFRHELGQGRALAEGTGKGTVPRS